MALMIEESSFGYGHSKELTVTEAVERKLTGFRDHGGGQLEGIESDVNEIKAFVARLVDHLCESNLIGAADVPKIFGYGFKAVE